MFDRSAITPGRLIQEFGLCDLKGNYQNTVKLRTKGWLAVLFFEGSEPSSAAAAKTLQSWTGILPADKVSILGVGHGQRESLKSFANENGLTYPIVWDFDDYVAGLYGLNSTPALLVTNAQGKVLAKIIGDDKGAFEAACKLVSDAVKAAEEAAAKAAEADAATAPAPARA